MHKFENLRVWQESVVLIKLIYLFCKKLPTSERNNLIDQIKRSSTSVALNIAEGSGSPNDIEYKRYLYISKKSLIEVIGTLKIAKELYNIDIQQEEIKATMLLKQLNSLINYLDSK